MDANNPITQSLSVFPELALMVDAVDPAPKVDFERLLSLASRVVGTPMAAITVVEGNTHTAPYAVGMENPKHEVYICSFTIKKNDFLIIPDTLLDPRVSRMEVVTGPPFVRFYVGVPLISPTGRPLGTLAMMDSIPRHINAQQKEDLKTFANQVMTHLELKKQREELEQLAGTLEECNHLAHLGHWEWIRPSEELSWSPELYWIAGRSPANPIVSFTNFLRMVHPDDRLRMHAIRDAALKNHASYEASYRLDREDGGFRYVVERGKVELDRQGQVSRMFGYAQDITATWLAEEAQRESEALFRSIFEQVAVGITLSQLDGMLVQANQRFASLLGYTPEEVCRVGSSEITYPEDITSDSTQRDLLLQGKIDTYAVEKRFRHKDGYVIWGKLTASVRRNKKGEPSQLISIVEDITVRKHAEAELLEQQQLTSEILDALPVNIYMKDADGRYMLCNTEAMKNANLSADEIVGKTDLDLYPATLARAIMEKDQRILQAGGQSLEETTIIQQGTPRVMLAGRRAITTKTGVLRLLGFSIDIHDRKQSELRAQYLATHDSLTGLPNRNLLQDRVSQAIHHAQRSKRTVALLFLDLDRFKLINDSFGHDNGDRLLQVMAERLRIVVRDGDTVARLGGDEFVVLLDDLRNEAEATYIAEKVLSQLALPVLLNNHELVISTSIGISIYRQGDQSVHTLLKEADIAMYQAKDQGGHGLRYFDKEMNLRVYERLLLENALRHALELNQLVLYYQPLVDLHTGSIVGMEALVRWNHPEKGLISPGDFIPVAEESGLIIALGEKVLRLACEQQRAWRAKGIIAPRISVNLSTKQFATQTVVSLIKSVLEETGISGSLLKLEITETGLMQDVTRASEAMRELAGLGIDLAIDDFGTGYSSLSYLKTLPIDTLKIDRSFVNDVVTDPDDVAIVVATIGMAHNMGLRVIAEGVETLEQLIFLANHHCDEGQGYYFSHPLTASEIEELLVEGKKYNLPAPIIELQNSP